MKIHTTARSPIILAIVALAVTLNAMAEPTNFQTRLNSIINSAGTERIDNTTGLPTQLISPDWADPGLALPEVAFDGLPLPEVAKRLRTEFKDEFDMLIPNGWPDSYPPPNTASPNNLFSPDQITVRLQLKDVTATQVFNAMNLEFEADLTPVRWELKMNGTRPIVVLRLATAMLPGGIQPAKKLRTVYFIGDLVEPGLPNAFGSEDPMKQVFSTVQSIYDLTFKYHDADELQFHLEAQLLVVTAPIDRFQFVQQTLSALRDKKRLEDTVKSKQEPPKAPSPAPAPNK